MPKRNREIKVLDDPIQKRNTKFKRSQFLMRKVQELATLCSLRANFSFFDPSINKLVEFVSDEQASIRSFNGMLDE